MTNPLKRRNHFSWGVKLRRRTPLRPVTQEELMVDDNNSASNRASPVTKFNSLKSNELVQNSPNDFYQATIEGITREPLAKRNGFRNSFFKFKKNIRPKKDKSDSRPDPNLQTESFKTPSDPSDFLGDLTTRVFHGKGSTARFENTMSGIPEEEFDENGQPLEVEYYDHNSREIPQLRNLTTAGVAVPTSRDLTRVENLPSSPIAIGLGKGIKASEVIQSVNHQQQLQNSVSLEQARSLPQQYRQGSPHDENIEDIFKSLTIQKQPNYLNQLTQIHCNNDSIDPTPTNYSTQPNMTQFEKYFSEMSNNQPNDRSPNQNPAPQNHTVMKMTSTREIANINLEVVPRRPQISSNIPVDPYSSLKLEDEMEKFWRNATSKFNKNNQLMTSNSRELKKYFELLQIKLANTLQYINSEDESELMDFNFAFRDFIGHLNAVIESVDKYGWVIGFLSPFLMRGNSSSQAGRLAFRETCLIISNICPYQLTDRYLLDKLWSRAWFLLIDVAQTPNGRDARIAYETLQSMMATSPLSMDILYKLMITRTLGGSGFYDKSQVEFRCMRISLLEIMCYRLLQTIEQRSMQPQFLTLIKKAGDDSISPSELLEYCKTEFDITFHGEHDLVVLDMIKKSGAVAAIRSHTAKVRKLKSSNLASRPESVPSANFRQHQRHQKRGFGKIPTQRTRGTKVKKRNVQADNGNLMHTNRSRSHNGEINRPHSGDVVQQDHQSNQEPAKILALFRRK